MPALLSVYESVFVIDNERLVHKVNEQKFMVIAPRLRSLQKRKLLIVW